MARFPTTLRPFSALLFAFFTVALLSLVACGGGDDTPADDAAPAAERARVPGEEAPYEEGEAPAAAEAPAPEIPPSEGDGESGDDGATEPGESAESDDPNAVHVDPQPAKSSEPDVD